jgi:DNA-binding NtrC family response regulator
MVDRKPRVLVVEDEPSVREGLVRALERLDVEVLPAANLMSARRIGGENELDAVLLDLRLPDGDGLDFLAESRDGALAGVPIIIASSFDDSDRTIRAMRLGAYEYLTKPFDLERLRAVVLEAVRSRRLSRLAHVRDASELDPSIVGRSEAMRAVWKAIGRAAATDAPVLVTGETGSGKELVARAIHRHSSRSEAPFVAVNLAGLAPSLLESELFGHERGAFTGALQRRAGRVEAAGAGTLFLDEIGDLDPLLQTKLLRLLQERTFERVGGTEPLPVACRFIAATHAAVRPTTEGSRMRADLYYRLAVLEIEVPPLRHRREDIDLLVHRGLERAGARGITEEALALLRGAVWPGNVRELLHVVERAAAAAAGEVIDVRHLPRPTPHANDLARTLAETLHGLTLREAVALVERTMVAVALEKTSGNRSRAARALGIGRPLLYAKMREHAVSDPRAEADPPSDDEGSSLEGTDHARR